MLQVNELSFSVNGKTLIENLNLTFEVGKLNLIIGPNGAGKSTLIKLLCNNLKPGAGAVYYSGKNVNQIKVEKLARIRSVLSQNIELAFPLTVGDVVMMGRYPHFNGSASLKDEKSCEEAMQLFDIHEMCQRTYMTLSGGEKQRVQFARVLAQLWYPEENSCRYLLLDEPLTFLDVFYQFDFMKKIKHLLNIWDIVIIGVVHDLNIAAAFADNLILLHQGKVLAAGNAEKVFTNENIKTAYNLEPVIYRDNEMLRLFFN